MSSPYDFQPPAPPTYTEQMMSLCENYFILALLVAITVSVILWRQNPPFIQRHSDDPLLQAPADLRKVAVAGMTTLHRDGLKRIW